MVFLFHGSLDLVDLGLNNSEGLVFNACLCLAFFVQHSAMLRKPFRRWMAGFVRTQYHGALCAISSGVVLLSLVIFWQNSGPAYYDPPILLRWALHTIFLLGIFGFMWGIQALGFFDSFGSHAIRHLFEGQESSPSLPFTIRGPYRWVRHPLYFFCLLLIWSCPEFTLDRLLYNVSWTAWIIVGTILEERDLVADFGETYRNYQKQVPMLIPKSIHPKWDK